MVQGAYCFEVKVQLCCKLGKLIRLFRTSPNHEQALDHRQMCLNCIYPMHPTYGYASLSGREVGDGLLRVGTALSVASYR